MGLPNVNKLFPRLAIRTKLLVAFSATVALSVLLVQTPQIALALHLTPLHLDGWALAVAGGVQGACRQGASWLARRSTRLPNHTGGAKGA